MERDHRIFRHKQSRIPCLQCQLNFLLEQKSRIGDAISHLDKILQRQVSDCIRVDLSRLLKLGENTLPIAAVTVDQFQQNSTVFESTINSLAEKRDDGMRRVSQQPSTA